jgi:hypothetical protein
MTEHRECRLCEFCHRCRQGDFWCRRLAPRVRNFPTLGEWPEVRADDWCGEFKRKEGKE